MSFCSEITHVKKTRKKHVCVYCGRTIPAGNSAMSWAWVDGGMMEQCYACLPCQWYVDNVRDNSETEIYPHERTEEWGVDCPSCGRYNNIGWNQYGVNATFECNGCGKTFNKPYGFDRVTEFGCDGEWKSED